MIVHGFLVYVHPAVCLSGRVTVLGPYPTTFSRAIRESKGEQQVSDVKPGTPILNLE